MPGRLVRRHGNAFMSVRITAEPAFLAVPRGATKCVCLDIAAIEAHVLQHAFVEPVQAGDGAAAGKQPPKRGEKPARETLAQAPGESLHQPSAVMGSMMVTISLTRVMGKPARRECSRSMASLSPI